MNCCICSNYVSSEEFEELGGLCKDCYKRLLPILNEKKLQNIQRLANNHQPIIKTLENGKPFYACYLPTMMEITEVTSEKTNRVKLNITINFGEMGLKRIGNLVGMGGFFYDAEYYWATTPEKIFKAWNWFSSEMRVNEECWEIIEADTARDFLDNNWKPYVSKFNDPLTHGMISLFVDLYALHLLKVNVTKKLIEIKKKT
jgi:hypothetical protein